MDDATKINIQKMIIKHLSRRRLWGGKHSEHLLSGLPKHLAGSKETEQAIRELIQKEWLMPAKKTWETHYSLNPNKAGEIKNFLEKTI